MSRSAKHRITQTGALSLSTCLGIICCIAGAMTAGYATGQLTGSRWLQFLFMLALFFGVPAGFITINEFTEQKWKQLPLVIRARSMLRWLPHVVTAMSFLGYGIFGNIIFVVGAYLLVLPGVFIIALGFLEKYAQQRFRA